ncbi:MAG: AGCS family alanine or glycine:cation symporter [Candidatus Binatia bacterium]|jgi:AGCS family alanine or glycine:cation symporter
METINTKLSDFAGLVWGLPLAVILVGTGILLTFLLGFIQLRGFAHAIAVLRGKYDHPDDPGEISHFQALCTALAATIGLGNIAGVGVAVSLGGPGAVFWMVLTGLVGMVTKYSECTLSLMYRRIDENGVVHGGPMYYIERGLGPSFKPLAVFFAVCCIFATAGAANMFQTNQVAAILKDTWQVPKLATGVTIMIMTALVLIGGIKRIGNVTSKLVPFMGIIYFLGAVTVLIIKIDQVPHVIGMIFHDAFNGTAVGGAAAAIAVRQVIVQGVRRACFSNEAGIGSAPIAHSAAATKEPVREGVVALLEPFIDTVVICSLTAFVILVSGVYEPILDGTPKADALNGVVLTAAAFDATINGFGSFFIPLAVFLFAYSTLLSWSYYGERSVDYLVGEKGILPYKIIFCSLAVVGAMWTMKPVLDFSDVMFGLMVIPNLIAVWLLFPKLKAETKSYFSRLKNGEFKRNE